MFDHSRMNNEIFIEKDGQCLLIMREYGALDFYLSLSFFEVYIEDKIPCLCPM